MIKKDYWKSLGCTWHSTTVGGLRLLQGTLPNE